MTQKVKITGSVTEVKRVEIDITPSELVKSALPYLSVDDIIHATKIQLERKMKQNDPDLPMGAKIDWYRRTWEIFHFNDYHKNEDVYKDIRKFNDEEIQYVLAIESIYHVLNN